MLLNSVHLDGLWRFLPVHLLHQIQTHRLYVTFFIHCTLTLQGLSLDQLRQIGLYYILGVVLAIPDDFLPLLLTVSLNFLEILL